VTPPPVVDADVDDGCGCAQGAGPSAPHLALGALALLLRRRSRR
jgi:uncharacterized protein (TIGR03382 family)